MYILSTLKYYTHSHTISQPLPLTHTQKILFRRLNVTLLKKNIKLRTTFRPHPPTHTHVTHIHTYKSHHRHNTTLSSGCLIVPNVISIIHIHPIVYYSVARKKNYHGDCYFTTKSKKCYS